MSPEGVLIAVEDRQLFQILDIGNNATRQSLAWIAVVVHHFEEVEVVCLDVAEMGLDGSWPRDGLRAEVVPERYRRPVGLPTFHDGGDTFDLIHGHPPCNYNAVADGRQQHGLITRYSNSFPNRVSSSLQQLSSRVLHAASRSRAKP